MTLPLFWFSTELQARKDKRRSRHWLLETRITSQTSFSVFLLTLQEARGSIHHPRSTFLYNLRTTCALLMKIYLSELGSRIQRNGVIYQYVLSRGISNIGFCFIPCIEHRRARGGCTLQTSNCRLEYLFTCMLGTFKLLFPRTLLSFSYNFYNIQFAYSLFMREGYEKGFEQ